MAFKFNINLVNVRWPSRQQSLACVLSLLILSFALFTLWFGHWFPASFPDKIIVREVALTSLQPPPPPPSPPIQQQSVNRSLSIQVQGAGVAIPKIELTQKLVPIKPDIPAINIQNTQWQSLEINWNAFDLNQLDGLPKLLTPLRVTFPKMLSRKGINQVLVKLDVVIDEQGQVTLVNVIENPYPELLPELHRLVRNSRFTAPKKDNQTVRARFIWPVNIKS